MRIPGTFPGFCSALRMVFILLLSGLTACATVVPLKEATHIPAERRYFPQPPLNQHLAKAIFLRDRGFFSGGSSLDLYINGTKAASFNVSERTEIYLKPGNYGFKIRPTDPDVDLSSAITQSLKADETYHYLLTLQDTGFGRVMTRIQRNVPDTTAIPMIGVVSGVRSGCAGQNRREIAGASPVR